MVADKTSLEHMSYTRSALTIASMYMLAHIMADRITGNFCPSNHLSKSALTLGIWILSTAVQNLEYSTRRTHLLWRSPALARCQLMASQLTSEHSSLSMDPTFRPSRAAQDPKETREPYPYGLSTSAVTP